MNDAGPSTAGYTFTLTQTVSVTQLGFFDSNNDGLSAAVPVTIWNGSGSALTSDTVPAGTGPEVNGYKYVGLATPLTLAPGTYTIGAYVTSSGDLVQYSASPAGAAGITYGAARSGSGNVYPTSDPSGLGAGSYFGPNFEISSAVPEPTTWLGGALLGGLAVAGVRRRVRRT